MVTEHAHSCTESSLLAQLMAADESMRLAWLQLDIENEDDSDEVGKSIKIGELKLGWELPG